VRKVSGFHHPSKANGFDRAVQEVTAVARRLVDSLVTKAPPRDRGGFEVDVRWQRDRLAEAVIRMWG
jgi:hypothetical protein